MDLLQLPEILIKKIITYIPNRWNLSYTCKAMYKIVCDLEKFTHFFKIEGFKVKENSVRLTIDDDVTFDSIMKTHREFNEIQVYLDPKDFMLSTIHLQPRQLERIIAIHKHFSKNITSIKWTCLDLTVEYICQLLQTLPKLESLVANIGKITGPASTQAITLPELKTIQVMMVSGFYKILNSLSASSVINSFIFTMDETSVSVRAFLIKQHNLKSLDIWHPVDATYIAHLQLDKLGFNKVRYTNNQLVEVLKSQPNLKRLSFEEPLSGDLFMWICENMKNLEKLEAQVRRLDYDILRNLIKLDKLQSFRTTLNNITDIYDVKSNTLTTLRIDDSDDLRLAKTIRRADFNCMAQNFPNVTNLELQVDSINQLCLLLSHFKKLTKYNGWIEHPGRHRFSNKLFPNMKHFSVINDDDDGDMSLLVDIVESMPNLKHLSVDIGMMFDLNLMKEFIDKSQSLKNFEMKILKFENDFEFDRSFLEMMRRLDNQFKSYNIIFKTTRGESHLRVLTGILSKEFHVRINTFYAPYTFTASRGGKEVFVK